MGVDLTAGPAGGVERDRFGRPLITPPEGGAARAYTRVTTFVDCLEDKWNLQKWQMRHVALGMVDGPRLQGRVDDARDDKSALDALCDEAMDVAGAAEPARTGTRLHSLTQAADEGRLFTDDIPVEHRGDVEAYRRAVEGLRMRHIERLTVCDALRAAGTPDRIVEHRGEVYIADVKTGRLDYGLGKICMQLALYAHCVLYDPASGRREPVAGLRQDKAIVIHLPAGQARCELYWVDIAAGWEGVQLASQVRTWRRRKHPLVAFDACQPRPSGGWGARIASAASVDELNRVWAQADAAGEWTDALTLAAADRKTAVLAGRRA
ncbi:MAG: PD-(D/E)XK nuclease family protein [Stackebrandtia sp.]